jgi:SAM-dependent methyltransferase
VDLGFRGEVTDYYHRYRRGYPEAVFDELAAEFSLTGDDVVVDLGCATGQLTLPMAHRVRAVVGMDPEADMVARGREAAAERGLGNVSWVVGADHDVPALGALLGAGALGAVTIGQALHWMDAGRLFPALRPLLRPGGGVAVISNGRPVWMQDRGWSRALRDVLEQWRGKPLTGTFGADDETRAAYRAQLVEAGFTVHERFVEHQPTMDLDQVVGNVLSALPVAELPDPEGRAELATRIGDALAPHAPFTEDVRVSLLAGRVA